jgi:dTDP-4-dehydrorhamnose reductase
MKRIGITGANGILGKTFYDVLVSESFYVKKISRDNLNFLDLNTFDNTLKEFDIVIHAAANTDVEFCEVNKNECFKDNVLLTEIIANVCIRNKIKLIFISSTGIYGNRQKEPYNEFDNPTPTTIYHYSKHLAEKEVEKIFNSLVLRVGWLFGGDYHQKKNFVARRIDEAKNCKKNVKSNIEQFGCPTYCLDVARQLLIFIQRDISGVFNCVNEGAASRFEFVKEIYDFLKIKIDLEATSAERFARIAKVSDNEMALNCKQSMIGMPIMRHWKESLHDYLKNDLYIPREN